MSEPPEIGHAANDSFCRYLATRGGSERRDFVRPDQVVRPYETLGTHPDLVARLWDEITTQLPLDCRHVVYGSPALVHPDTKIVFGFAAGTHTYALRLPEPARSEALSAGAERIKKYPSQPSFDLEVIGPEWVFCGWFKNEERWCLQAYELAGAGGGTNP